MRQRLHFAVRKQLHSALIHFKMFSRTIGMPGVQQIMQSRSDNSKTAQSDNDGEQQPNRELHARSQNISVRRQNRRHKTREPIWVARAFRNKSCKSFAKAFAPQFSRSSHMNFHTAWGELSQSRLRTREAVTPRAVGPANATEPPHRCDPRRSSLPRPDPQSFATASKSDHRRAR